MFVFDSSTDLDIATYEYRIYEEDQVEPDPANPGYYRLIENVSINSGTITPYSQGFNPSNVFTVAVENSTTTSTTTTTSPISYYGAVRTIDTSANASAWTLITITDTSTPLIDEEFIGSLTAAKITAGTIGAHEIILTQAGTPTSYTAPANVSVLRSSNYVAGSSGAGWLIRGDGFAEFDSTNIRGSISASSINLNTHNYWLPNSSNPIFKVGSSTKYFQWDGTDLTTTGNLITNATVTGGTVGGITVGSGATVNRFYIGTGTFNNANTAFYVDNTGQFSLKDKLTFNPTTSTLTLQGRLQAGDIYIPNTSSPVFSVTTAGAITATTGKIGPVNITTSSMNSQGSSPYLNASSNYYNFDNYGDIYIYSNPGTDVAAGTAHVNQYHSTALVGEYIQIKKTSTSAFSDNLYEARIGDISGTYAEVVVQNASTSSYAAMYSTGNMSLTGSINGYSFTSGRHNGANQMVHTDGNGYLQVGYINSSNGNEGNNSSPSRVWGTNGSDDYLRSYLTSALSVGTASRLVSTQNNSINTTGLYPSSVVEPLSIKQNDASGQNTISYRNEDNTLLMYVTDTGNVRGQGNYQNVSDRNSKENIVYVDREVLGNAIDFIKPATFNYINGTEKHLGFIAQDVQEFLPDAIKSFDENRLSIDTDVIIAALVAKCQQLEQRLSMLE